MQNPALEQAVQFAKEHESTWDHDCASSNWGVHHGDPAPYNKLYGPVHSRGPNSGTILLRGKTLTSSCGHTTTLVVTWQATHDPSVELP